jgi:hypothetical protein
MPGNPPVTLAGDNGLEVTGRGERRLGMMLQIIVEEMVEATVRLRYGSVGRTRRRRAGISS